MNLMKYVRLFEERGFQHQPEYKEETSYDNGTEVKYYFSYQDILPMVNIYENSQKIYIGFFAQGETVSEEARIKLSEIIHTITITEQFENKAIDLGDLVIKDLNFYQRTIEGNNQSVLLEIVKKIKSGKKGFSDARFIGKDGEIMAKTLKSLGKGEIKQHPTIRKSAEYETYFYFNEPITKNSFLKIKENFSIL